MYLILFKKGLNTDKITIPFEKALTFGKANDILLDAVTKFKQTGQRSKVSYKIVEIDSGDSLLNSKLVIDSNLVSLFDVIRSNKNAPDIVKDYINKVESKEIVEEENTISFNTHQEEKQRLDTLKTRKSDIQQSLREQEKEEKNREIEYQQNLEKVQKEIEEIEKSIQLKEKEAATKESEREEKLRKLQYDKQKATELMKEKRIKDKEKREEHEHQLKMVEEEAKKVELELSSIETELEQKELERKKELLAFEERKKEAIRSANLLKAEDKKNDLQQREEALDFKEEVAATNDILEEKVENTIVPKPTFKDRIKELDFEEVKSLSVRFMKVFSRNTVNVSKIAYKGLREYVSKRQALKEEKIKNQSKQLAIDEQIAQAKVQFIDELHKDKQKQEKEMKKELSKKEKEAMRQAKIENRYRAEIKKKNRYYPAYHSNRPVKLIVGTVAFLMVVLTGIHYLNLSDTFPVLQEVENYVDTFLATIRRNVQG
ncbi:hypothetical protein [Paraliobacillus ryukyuensis]|uniref:hypothetical protein n=1 Tax=Paraliobacillus ryukyuensis TaxID=200904 RepID=UPI0009A628AD|nr:hypothetical protein [Paraliobacillus ryukyuensis]